MGTSSSLEELNRKLSRAVNEVEQAAASRSPQRIAVLAKQTAERIGGSMSRHLDGPRLTADVRRTAHSVTILPRPASCWAIREKGAKPHLILGDSMPVGGGFAQSVDHPGVRGQNAWTKVSQEVAHTSGEIVDDEVQKGLRRVF